MDDKEITPFAKGLLILGEGYWEERGHTLIGAKVVMSDSDPQDQTA